MIFDNVYCVNVTEEVVELRVGQCDPELLQNGELIADEQVENVKTIRINASDYAGFLNTVISFGVKLQKEFGIDVGLEIEVGNDG